MHISCCTKKTIVKIGETQDIKKKKAIFTFIHKIIMEATSQIYIHNGSVSGEEGEKVLQHIEDITLNHVVHSSLWKRVYIVAVELLSNIERHAVKRPDIKDQFIRISKEQNSFLVEAGNILTSSDAEILRKKIDVILDHADYGNLKQYYLDKVVTADISVKGGAGLGLITIAKACRNQFTYRMTPLTKDLSFFTIQIKVETD